MKKMTKAEMVENIKGFINDKNKAVKDMVKYVVDNYTSNPRNVTMEDLKDTLASIKEILATDPIQVALPIENSVKKVAHKKATKTDKTGKKIVAKKETKSVEEGLDELEKILVNDQEEVNNEEENLKEETKKVAKKTAKKVEPKKEEPKAEPKEGITTIQFAKSFPEEIDSVMGKLRVRRDIQTIQELHDLVEDGAQLVMCEYWNKRQLKQFTYDQLGINPKKFKEFPNDLDILDVMYASENGLVVYCVSLYSEVARVFTAKNFATDEETGLRYEDGGEYQIYELMEE